MKNSNKVVLAVIICFLLSAVVVAFSVRGNFIFGEIVSREKGTNITKNFNIGNFSELDLAGFGNVSIKAGEQPSVSITTDEGYFSYITVDLSGSKLNINTEHRTRGWHAKKIDITIVTNHPLKKIAVRGASDLDYANINSDSLALEVSGASDCNLSGKINSLQIEISGASHVNAKNLIADNARLEISGTADIDVYAKKFLEIHAYGAANVNYYGNPKNVVRNVFGMASIKSMD